ncbi:hypothetical protein [Haloarcula pellucida]|uniref:Uncharacterized protein n=1 Tax=Haloarcula pellucida TaxID=1427151 RepID=A0A830GQ61_9EURY|nr:hypothetical protein [Halomicroarcula pellucida]MBX0350381.1 hypothetical protein [Halomicroarcula pellucida]GGO01805.1 hypothetical protein GCM10009030_35850 [Halomicroarcula pellucida]
MATGYCTTEDLRRALRKASLPGDVTQDTRIAADAIVSRTEWLEKTYDRHWYAPTGAAILDEASNVDIPTSTNTRDDEEDIPTHGGMVHGASENERYRYRQNSDALLESGPRYERRRKHYQDPKEEIRIAFGRPESLEPPVDDTVPAYTRITLARKDAKAVNSLSVVNAEGAFDDWVASNDYDGGVGNTHRGEDYWVRVNNGGVSELYLDVHAMDDDIPSFSDAVYVDFDYGHEGIPRTVRRAVANWAAADLVEEAVIEIPQNATVYNVETKADELERKAEELMEVYE